MYLWLTRVSIRETVFAHTQAHILEKKGSKKCSFWVKSGGGYNYFFTCTWKRIRIWKSFQKQSFWLYFSSHGEGKRIWRSPEWLTLPPKIFFISKMSRNTPKTPEMTFFATYLGRNSLQLHLWRSSEESKKLQVFLKKVFYIQGRTKNVTVRAWTVKFSD